MPSTKRARVSIAISATMIERSNGPIRTRDDEIAINRMIEIKFGTKALVLYRNSFEATKANGVQVISDFLS